MKSCTIKQKRNALKKIMSWRKFGTKKKKLARLCSRRKVVLIQKSNTIKKLKAQLKESSKAAERKTAFSKTIEKNLLLKECVENSMKKKNARRYKYSREFATRLRLASPAAFKIVRAANFITIPHIKTTTRWQHKLSVQPGFNNEVLQRMEKLGRTMPINERVVTILIDAISIKPILTYQPDSDTFYGLPDNYSNAQELIFAKEAVTVMVRSLSSNFKQVIF